MEQERPPYYSNDLKPVEITEQGLKYILGDLEPAVQRGIAAITKEDAANGLEDFGTIFSGHLGTAYAFLRLDYQSRDQQKTEQPTDAAATPQLLELARARVDAKIGFSTRDITPGRPSPITSPTIGAIVLRVLSRQWLEQDPKNLLAVMEIAISQAPTFLFREHPMGVDEILYGRAGLLWSLLEIWKRSPDQETQSAFAAVFQNIHRLVKAIVDAGKVGAKAYRDRTSKQEFIDIPLMWSWFDDFYGLGAMHGIAGVLAILLDPALPRHAMSVVESYGDIAQTISALSKLCVLNNGHLPMSVPSRPTSRSAPLVQICHGAPGMLTLLAAAKRNPKFASLYWNAEWEEAIKSASDVIWTQGLLSKGGSLCHGIAGNALSLLVLVNPFEDSTNGHLAAALAMLSEAKFTPPFTSGDEKYRVPDHPWSLFEGLAGLMCAWSEACLLIKLKLRIMELKDHGVVDVSALARDEQVLNLQQRLLGFPCLVGGGSGDSQTSFLA